LPGSRAFSIATAGCNLECKCCQNWDISQSKPEDVDFRFMPPDEVVRNAKDYDACVTFTYSEPIVFLEYCIDTAKAARKAGVRTTMVTGGSGEAEPMKEALKYLDAVKVDLKGFTEDYYQRMCKGQARARAQDPGGDSRQRGVAGAGSPVRARPERQRAGDPRPCAAG
jgi:pyruvate formate lyase activating enzyme